MEIVISNHFLCKDLVHHPIDSQPFIPIDGHHVPGLLVNYTNLIIILTNRDFPETVWDDSTTIWVDI